MPQQERQRAARQAQGRTRLIGRRRVAQQARPGPDQPRREDRRDDQPLPQFARKLQHDPAKPRADDAAKAPEPVAGRHDRPCARPLDRDGIGVHRDIHAAHRAAEQEDRRRDRPEARRKRYPQKRGRRQPGRKPDRRTRPRPCRHRPEQRHHRDRAQPQAQHQKARAGFRDPQPLHQRRNARGPAADQQPVQQKQRRDRGAFG